MYRTYRNAKEVPRPASYGTKSNSRLSFIIRRSTIINFLAILLIFGAVFALHTMSKKFVFSSNEEQIAEPAAEAAEDIVEPAVQQAPEVAAEVPVVTQAEGPTIHTLPALAPIQVDEGTATVEAEGEATEKPAEAADVAEVSKEAEPEEPAPVAKKKKWIRPKSRRGKLYRAGSAKYAADREFGVELLDNEQSRRSYLEANKRGAPSEPAYDTVRGVETHSIYTMPEEPAYRGERTYAYDDLDGIAAREHYRKQNKKLSTVDLD